MTRAKIAVGGLCAVLALAATEAALGANRDTGAKRLVVFPRNGQVLPARPVAIRVRTGRKAKRIRVRLNGQPVAKYFSSPSRHGVRRLQASASYGLRHGGNRLRVEARGRRGRWRSRTVRFRIRRNRPLAAAGFDRNVAAGDRVYLNGKRSRSHLVGRGGGRSRVRHRWKIVRAPGGSLGATRIAHARSARPHFAAERPGHYVIQLTVRASDKTAGSDVVDIRADPVPAVHVDTMAFPNHAGQSGVEVGDAFYPSKPKSWAQLVALDRTTLEPASGKMADLANKAYLCTDPSCTTAQFNLASDLKRLGGDDVVIVASPYSSSGGGRTPFGLESVLARIGVSPTGFDQRKDLASPGGISAIGVPGTAPGKGNWHSEPAARSGAGRMNDYLIRNNEGHYVFAPSDRVQFNTQAQGSDPMANVVQIGDGRFSTDLVPRHGGFQLVVVNPQTLKGTSQWFATSQIGVEGSIEVFHMEQALEQANKAGNELVFLESRGAPPVRVEGTDGGLNETLSALAAEVEKLGGTRNAIYKALDPGLYKNYSYTLVGSSNAGAGAGEEFLAGGTTDLPIGELGLNTAAMSGTLARTGPNYGFESQSVPDVGEPSPGAGADPSVAAAELNQVLVQKPSAWPEHGDAGRTAAIAWIGRQVFGTSDPRSQYWTVIYKPDTWTGYSTHIGNLSYAGDAGFTAADLAWAKAALRQEIGWLKNVHSYLENLSEPFSRTQLQSWAAFQQISNSIRDKVGIGADQTTMGSEKAYWQGLRTLLGAIPEVGHGFHAADAVYETVMQLVEIGNEPAENDFQAKADELGVRLADRFTAAQEMLTREVPNSIAADYAKLRTVGSCTSGDPKDWSACPFDHSNWQFTQDDQANAAKLLVPGMQTWAYGSLLAARYKLYGLPPWWRTVVGAEEFYGLTIDAIWYPFDGLPGSAQYAKPIYRDIPTHAHSIDNYQSSGETWKIYALGYLSGSGVLFDRWTMHYPKADVTDPIFKPVDRGGLGADPEGFFDRFFPKPSTLDHYPERDTPTGWCAGGIRGPSCD